MLKRTLVILALAASGLSLGGCSSFPLPDTQGDPQNAVAYGYQPLDPVPVIVQSATSGKVLSQQEILNALPDETMRMAIGKVDVSGNITYGPASVSASHSSYVVTIDYVKSNTFPIFIQKSQTAAGTRATTVKAGQVADLSVPVYIGVGLRITANLTTTQAGVNLGNLVAIGAAAQAGTVSGTLVVQTLGITGEVISTALPIPTEISATSIQTAIQALGTMKAKMYDSKTTIQPRVVGVYNNIGGGRDTINGFITTVLENPPTLTVP